MSERPTVIDSTETKSTSATPYDVDTRIVVTESDSKLNDSRTCMWLNYGDVPRDASPVDPCGNPIPPRPASVRWPRIVEFVKTHGADLIGLTEVKDFSPDYTVPRMLCDLSGSRYRSVDGRISAVTGREFSLVLLYDKTKFWCVGHRIVIISESQTGRKPLKSADVIARHVLVVTLCPVYNARIQTQKSFCVCLTHLNISKDNDISQNLAEVEWLNKNLPTYCDNLPYMLMMDTNWFPSLGDDCRLKCQESHNVWFYKNGVDFTTGSPVWATFIGLKSDPYYNPHVLTNNEKSSPLDVIVTDKAHDWKLTDPIVYVPEDLDDPYADHMPIQMTFVLPN